MMDVTAVRFRPASVTVVVMCLLIFVGSEAASVSNVRKSSGTTTELGVDNNNNDAGLMDRMSRKIIVETKDVELKCPIPHDSPQSVEWYKQNPGGRGKKRITQFRNRYELSNGEITIHSMTPEDAGTFVCKVSDRSELHFFQLVVSGEQGIKNNHLKLSQNRKGTEEAYLEPQIAKNILPKQKIYYASKGFPILLLKCESSGNPKPTITWYKNGGMISSSTTNVSTLKLVNVSQADSGHYKCESVNLFGISKYEVTIQVTDYWFGSSEILELSPRNVTIKEGNSVNISCVARFEMDPWFSWVRRVASNKTENGKVFFHSGTSSYYEVLKSTLVRAKGESGVYSTNLIITNVTRNDSGIYYCAVAGLQGFNLSDTTITVEPDPTLSLHFNEKGVAAAQWAILWTISFIFLVMLVIICFVNLYGCRPHKPKQTNLSRQPPTTTASTSSTTTNTTTKNKSRNCLLPESSPLTMSTTQESFVPLMVGGSGGSESCSGLSSYGDGCPYESDCYDSPSPTASNNILNNYHQHEHEHTHFPASSWIVSNGGGNIIISSNNSSANESFRRSYRPNSMCSDYSSVSNNNNSNNNNPYNSIRSNKWPAVVEVHRSQNNSCNIDRGWSSRKKYLQPNNKSNQQQNYYYSKHYPINYKCYDENYCQSPTASDVVDYESFISQGSHQKNSVSRMSVENAH